MHTNRHAGESASKFRRAVKVALAQRDWTVDYLAERIGRHRNSTSRAINRGEFPKVREAIRKELGL